MTGIRDRRIGFLCAACLASAGHAALARPARDVIVLISDGQGFGTVMAADYHAGKRAVYEGFPHKYFAATFPSGGAYDPATAWQSFDAQLTTLTDSAATATAMATGVKVPPGMVGAKPGVDAIKNLVETASEQGKAAGVVTTVPFSEATPAGFCAHAPSRNDHAGIARQMIYGSELDVIMGAGHPWYDNNGNLRQDGRQDYEYVGGPTNFLDLIDPGGATAKDGLPWLFIESRKDFEALASGALRTEKVFGLAQAGSTLQQGRDGDPQIVDATGRNTNVPDLATMTLGALNVLSADPDGFFLVVEGGAVDWANHAGQKGRCIEEQLDFNRAAEAVAGWVEANRSWDETLVIVTADHETGYLWGSPRRRFIPVRDRGAGKIPRMAYHSAGHSNLLVPLYARGCGAERFAGFVEGADPVLARLLRRFDPGFSRGAFVDDTAVFAVANEAMAPERPSSVRGSWYRGDLHAHSRYSDGDSPVAEVIRSAEARGLDFFAITDHDTSLNGMPLHWVAPGYKSDRLVLLYGVEWTTAAGHANVWAGEIFDCRGLWLANQAGDAYLAMAAAHEEGALFSPNHPAGYAVCPWEYPIENDVDCLEVWNAMYALPSFNLLAGHGVWDGELRSGRRPTGIGGSDTHDLDGFEASLFGHGNPTTWVFAETRSPQGIVAGLRAGHVSMSWAPDAPRIDLWADADGDGAFDRMAGDNIVRTPGLDLVLRVSVQGGGPGSGAPPVARELAARDVARLTALGTTRAEVFKLLRQADSRALVVFRNGAPLMVWEISGDPAASFTIEFGDTPDDCDRTYYRAELFGNPEVDGDLEALLYGHMLAMTNPIYVGYPLN